MVSMLYNLQLSCFVTILLLLNRGDDFRKEYSRLGEIRSILSKDVHIMALTATATKTLREDISSALGMQSPR